MACIALSALHVLSHLFSLNLPNTPMRTDNVIILTLYEETEALAE